MVYANDGPAVFFLGGIGGSWYAQQVAVETANAEGIHLPIIVAIAALDRDHEYLHKPIAKWVWFLPWTSKGGGLPQYANYVADHVVKFIDANYRTKTERKHRVVLGSSHGGLAAFYTGVVRGDVFGNVVAMSASFWAGTMKPLWKSRLLRMTRDDLHNRAKRPRIYIDWGLRRDGGFHNSQIEKWATWKGQDMRDRLRNDFGYVDGLDLLAVEDPHSQHHEPSWNGRLPRALKFALSV